MDLPPDRVVTIHGIWTEGRWQEEIAPVLYPHFVPVSVKYRSYRYAGPLDLICEPIVLLAGLVVWALGWWWLSPQRTVATLFLAAVIVVAHLTAGIRLGKTLRGFVRDTDATVLRGRMHLIAHSLGSLIVCRALRSELYLRPLRLVLAGCVVDPGYDWSSLKQKVGAVRNEVATADFVSAIASLLRWRIDGIGRAGQIGFTPSDVVHTVPTVDGVCPQSPNGALVHNYVSAGKGHSGVLSVTTAKYLWLPFFWGFEPSEFQRLLDDCAEMVRALKEAGSPSTPPPGGPFDKLATDFLGKMWEWADAKTIPAFLADSGRVVPKNDEKLIVLLLSVGLLQAEDALGAKIEAWRADRPAEESYRSAAYDERIRALDPRVALSRAFTTYANPSPPPTAAAPK
jgi:hypothetical protein